MTVENQKFAEQTRWEKCQGLVGGIDWQAQDGDDQYSHVRSVTWAEYPMRYMLTGYGDTDRQREKKIAEKAFEVVMLSAVLSDINRKLYKRYFIFRNGNVALFDATVGEPDDPQTKVELRESFDFVIENQLYTPNEQDLLTLDHALKLGHQDGVSEYSRS